MQTLQTPELTKEYDLDKQIAEALRPKVKPTLVKVAEDASTKTVLLTIGDQPGLVLSLQGAWDLARELRKAANRISSNAFVSKAGKHK